MDTYTIKVLGKEDASQRRQSCRSSLPGRARAMLHLPLSLKRGKVNNEPGNATKGVSHESILNPASTIGTRLIVSGAIHVMSFTRRLKSSRGHRFKRVMTSFACSHPLALVERPSQDFCHSIMSLMRRIQNSQILLNFSIVHNQYCSCSHFSLSFSRYQHFSHRSINIGPASSRDLMLVQRPLSSHVSPGLEVEGSAPYMTNAGSINGFAC